MNVVGKPKVSVCIVTYNHEKYIRQCLQSIIDQETTFEFEVIVGDDGSTDGTSAIVREFEANYPDVVRLIQHGKNIGPTANYIFVHSVARGQYVSHLDGDDYALPGKLQAQADCLDRYVDVAFAVHSVGIIDSSNALKRKKSYPVKGSLSDLLMLGTYFVHSSVMYRRSLGFSDSGSKEKVDFCFHIERARAGAIYFDDRILGCYRIHANGISQSRERRSLIEACYEDAYDRALELGAPAHIVRAGRLKRRMAFAIDSLVAGEVEGYRTKISLCSDEFRYASKKHVILHFTKRLPILVRVYLRVKDLKFTRLFSKRH